MSISTMSGRLTRLKQLREETQPYSLVRTDKVPEKVTPKSAESLDRQYVGEEFILGRKLTICGSPLASIQHYLARRVHTEAYFVIKMVTTNNATPTKDEIQARTLLLAEYALLSRLQNEPGIFHERGLIEESIKEKFVNPEGEVTWKEMTRSSLIVECYVPHEFDRQCSGFTTLHLHVIQQKRLKEAEAIRILFKMLEIVNRVHGHNIIHRDLKLRNFILNRETGDVALINFHVGQHLTTEHQLMVNQLGTPAYFSPELISGRPYCGKSSDIWALGVSLYAMLFGIFPFYAKTPTELFQKIKMGKYDIPATEPVSVKTIQLIGTLLEMDWKKRPTADNALKMVHSIIVEERASLAASDSDVQVVPASDLRRVSTSRIKPKRLVRSSELKDFMKENEGEIKALVNSHEGGPEVRDQMLKCWKELDALTPKRSLSFTVDG